MMFLFAYIAQAQSAKDWPVGLIRASEAALVATALACLIVALRVRGMRAGPAQEIVRNIVAVVGGISAGVGLIMPVELAPIFFGVRGEWMMATMILILVYPVAAVLLILAFYRAMQPTRPPALPTI